MSRRKPEPKKEDKSRQPRQRLFTNDFKIGDTVSIIRHEHGWSDGNISGKITSMSPHSAEVKDDDGYTYEIDHPRDIRGSRG